MLAKSSLRSNCRAARLSAAAFASLVAVVLMASVPAHAQVYWSNTASGDWSVGSNWSTGTVPTSSDTAYIANGGTATVTQPEPYAYITLGGTSGSGNVVMTGGSWRDWHRGRDRGLYRPRELYAVWGNLHQ